MAAELKATNPAVNIEILGINRTNQSAFNQFVIASTTLPWLQDTLPGSVWDLWQVTWRDVRILDPQGRLFAVYNLTTYDLAEATNRATLKQLFLDAARFIDTDNDKLLDDWEILNFGNLSTTPEGDADGDGEDNFSEYAFGTDPKSAASKTSFRPIVTGAGANRVLKVTFRRRAGSGLDYFIDSSTDILPWASPAGSASVIEPFNNLFNGTGTGDSTCAVAAPIPGQARSFLRVRAVPKAQP